MNLKVYDYSITGDPDEADHRYHYSPKITSILHKFHGQVQRPNARVLSKLIKAIKEYPRVPALRNYLSTYYIHAGNGARAFEINKKIIEDFPDYLISRINLAAEHMLNKNYDQIPIVLGPALDVGELYPERKVFHYNEVIPYTQIVIHYLSATQQYEELERRLPIYEKIFEPEDEILLRAKTQVNLAKMAARRENNKFQANEYDETLTRTEPPTFHHPEVAELLDVGMDELAEHLPALISLPPPTLTEDLVTLFADAYHRYPYWKEQEEVTNFPYVALTLLMQLRAPEQLPAALTALRQGDEFLNFWYGEVLFEDFWRVIYPVAVEHLPQLQAFLKEPNLHYTSKNVILDVLQQLSLHEPEGAPAVIAIYHDLLRWCIEHRDDHDLVDKNFCSFLVVYAPVRQDSSLLPLVKELFDLDMIFTDLVRYEDLTEKLESTYDLPDEKKPLSRNAEEEIKRFVADWYS